MSKIMDLDKEYIASTYNRYPVCFVKGEGSILYDEDGKRYVDMSSGIAVNSFGIADEKWQQAVISQVGKLQHVSNLYYSEPCVKAAELLCGKSGMKKVFFCNSGTESNEAAIKVARKYAAEKKGEDYYTIITLENSFHGRTLAALAATGQEELHQTFKPMMAGFIHTPANDKEALMEAVKNNKIAAIMIECVQGEGGVMKLDDDFIKCIAGICEKEDILMICDEVQTGNGRSGYMYAYQGFGVQPDVATTAKGLAGGLPIGAVLLGEKVKNVFVGGDHGATFGGNLISCAAACSILERLDDVFFASVREKSEYCFKEFEGAEGIEAVDGMGLMIGLKTIKPAADIINECLKHGVVCLPAHGRVRLLPALNIPQELLAEAVSIIKEVCKA
ncbi:MAG: acetylornithine/succinylornithine family transaminase [Mogibacterium sp.]|nr:acetylornithine/succinylornithine family transaminase [Mogibacterium sp.]